MVYLVFLGLACSGTELLILSGFTYFGTGSLWVSSLPRSVMDYLVLSGEPVLSRFTIVKVYCFVSYNFNCIVITTYNKL